MRPFGYHISGGQRLGSNLRETANSGFTAAQIFLGPPQKMDITPLPAEEVRIFKEVKKSTGMKVYVHAPYVLHVFAKPENKQKNDNYVAKMVGTATELGCDGFVLHMGGTKWYEEGQYLDVAESLLKTISRDKDAWYAQYPHCPVLFENCANGNDMSGMLSQITLLLDQLRDKGFNVGLCLDTCHAWAWGYQLDLEQVQKGIGEEVRQHLQLIHLNSAPGKVLCGGRYDRHESISAGCIDPDAFKGLLNSLPKVPAIAEGHSLSGILSDWSFVKHVDAESVLT